MSRYPKYTSGSEPLTCPICGSSKRVQFHFCGPCAEKHGLRNLPYRKWPTWAKEIARDGARYAQRVRRGNYELPLDPERFSELDTIDEPIAGLFEIRNPDELLNELLDQEIYIASPKNFTNSYAEYMQSEEWWERRWEIIERDGGCCIRCKSTDDLQVHHLSYERLGDEEDADLVTLCLDCHNLIHASGPLR